MEGQIPPACLLELARSADTIFASTRKRAVETADAVVQGKHFIRDPVFIEAPLPPPSLPAFIKLKPVTWGFLARVVWWFFGHHEGEETRGEAAARARCAAERLIEASKGGATVLLLAHGFFNLMVGRNCGGEVGARAAAGDTNTGTPGAFHHPHPARDNGVARLVPPR